MKKIRGEWLAVSTQGFAEQNAGRPLCHLIKELVQNSFDAIDGHGNVDLRFEWDKHRQGLLVHCSDDGAGLEDLSKINVLFWTGKKDSHLKRGRMGRGFKELLCLAEFATVSSRGKSVKFTVANDGARQIAYADGKAHPGTHVRIFIKREAEIKDLEHYFQSFIVPRGITFRVNGELVEPREVKYQVSGTLPTEAFEEGRWRRPSSKTVVDVIPIKEGEEALVFELGIPVCPVEWTVPFHANIDQRIPMNPNRDAVASGFLAKVHALCLPILLPAMSEEAARDSWVGEAGPRLSDDLQKQIIHKAFGTNLARSVPSFGKFSMDDNAREEAGVTVIDTRQLSGGFRELAQAHVRTSAEIVKELRQEKLQAAAQKSFDFDQMAKNLARDTELATLAGGSERIRSVCGFAKWFCEELLRSADHVSQAVTVVPANLESVRALATWSESSILTLGLNCQFVWRQPLCPDSISLLVHEASHYRAMHHGLDFTRTLESFCGHAAVILFRSRDYILETFPTILGEPGTR